MGKLKIYLHLLKPHRFKVVYKLFNEIVKFNTVIQYGDVGGVGAAMVGTVIDSLFGTVSRQV